MSLQPRSMEVLPRRGRPGPRGRPAARPGDGRGRGVPAGGLAGGPARPGGGRGRRPLDGGAAGGRAAGLAAGAARARPRRRGVPRDPGQRRRWRPARHPAGRAGAARRRSSTAPCPSSGPRAVVGRRRLPPTGRPGLSTGGPPPDRHNESLTCTARPWEVMEIWPGSPYPLGATYDGAGTNFALFSEAAERVELCLFDDDGDGDSASSCREVDGVRLARLPAAASARAALRLPGARPVRPGARASAATRPSCCSTRTPRRSRARSTGTSRCSRYRFDDPDARQRRRQPRPHDALRRGQPVLRLGQRPAAAARVPRDGHLRGARQGPDDDAPRRPRGDPRHLRRRWRTRR